MIYSLYYDLRKPGQSVVTTQRKETDKAQILSGTFNGYTTGAPICTGDLECHADSEDEYMK